MLACPARTWEKNGIEEGPKERSSVANCTAAGLAFTAVSTVNSLSSTNLLSEKLSSY